MTDAVAQAIAQLGVAFPDCSVTHEEDGDGGAYVIIDGVDIGESFAPRITWIGFRITYPYPESDVYPLFIDATATYHGDRPTPNQHADGNLPVPMTRGAEMPGFKKAAVQVSRRSNRRDANTDTAAHKVLRVLDVLRSL